MSKLLFKFFFKKKILHFLSFRNISLAYLFFGECYTVTSALFCLNLKAAEEDEAEEAALQVRPVLICPISPSPPPPVAPVAAAEKARLFFAVHKIFIRILFSLLLLLQISANLRMWSRTPPGKERKNREEDSPGLTPVPRPLNCRRRCRHYCRSSAVQPSQLPSRWRSPSTRTTGRGRTQKQ